MSDRPPFLCDFRLPGIGPHKATVQDILQEVSRPTLEIIPIQGKFRVGMCFHADHIKIFYVILKIVVLPVPYPKSSGSDSSVKISFREYDFSSSPSESRAKTANAILAYTEAVAKAAAAYSSSVKPGRQLRLL